MIITSRGPFEVFRQRIAIYVVRIRLAGRVVINAGGSLSAIGAPGRLVRYWGHRGTIVPPTVRGYSSIAVNGLPASPR